MWRHTRFPDVLPVHVQFIAWLLSCVCCALISFAVTWGFFETLGAWRWP